MAGNIIPAIATTNAVIAGCILTEAIKILNNQVPYTLSRQFMYLRAILCTFPISADFYYVHVGGRGGRGWAREGEARERGRESILYGYSCNFNCTREGPL
jgi:hypothetical protein